MPDRKPRAMTASGGFGPLSGPVSQVFEFWADWFRSVGQIGLINVNLGAAGDEETERRILDEAGSYGRQLGQVVDALEVLIRRSCYDESGAYRTDLAPEELRAIVRFEALAADIARAKKPR